MRPTRIAVFLLGAALTLAGCRSSATPQTPAAAPDAGGSERPGLQPVSAFDGISDRTARSVALFVEAGRVIAHPRCVNCHPADGVPRQGMEQRLHVPKVQGGADGHGTAGLPCTGCHQQANTQLVGATLRSIPGNPKWALAPAEMAWVGKSLGEICEQLKDPKRNGGKSLEQLHHHMAEDVLVGWGWDPGPGLQPVPGTQAQLGALIRAWMDTGAACPRP
ncbi:Isoquinoline 1-oxidoreductase subunit [Pyxidicoccus fallax]|uniref:Isoquinoline 1-oxidoreductase subunit n=1 Tax=Pyxidicoccus fallax TaxID=394095 RepID=A0A848L943_9BACT|nr:Isoquinoline 1-oxidoreductase subunit [Pyxidicoccus fallax]NMO15349.1 Isoquinoline 1-oxidoreductase subunit [Pyxidicoccus fallax]NPC77269.1 Isoquinoline 1-oxidoreductase subunit [Pyxidicoccus fallax]